MTRFFARVLVTTTAVLAVGCSGRTDLPTVRTEGFPPAVRQQIKTAQDDAHANPGNAATVARFGRTLLAYRFDESALPCFRRAHAVEGDSFRWPYYIGLILQARGEYREAIEYFRLTLKRKPGDAPTLLRLADSLSSAQDWKAAEETYRLLLEASPSARAHYGLGRVYDATGLTSKAVDQFNRACGRFSKYADARRALAGIYRKQGNAVRLREQVSLLNSTADRSPPDADPLLAQARELDRSASGIAAAGMNLLEAGLPKAALRELNAAVQIDPRDLDAHLYSIAAYQRLENFDSARAHYESATAISPDEPLVYLYHARGLTRRGRFEDAIPVLNTLTALDPGNVEAWTLLGDAELASARTEEAAGHYRRAYKLDPDSPAANNGLGLIHYGRRDLAAALPLLEKAQDMPDSRVLPALEALSDCYLAAGQAPEAIRALRHARAVATMQGPAAVTARINARLARIDR